jgi:hypothetical protein
MDERFMVALSLTESGCLRVVSSCLAVSSGSSVLVNCSVPSGGWPASGFNVTLTAVSPTSCTSGTATTKLALGQSATLAGPATNGTAVCAASNTTTLSFSLAGGGSNSTAYTLATSTNPAQVACTIGANTTTGECDV